MTAQLRRSTSDPCALFRSLARDESGLPDFLKALIAQDARFIVVGADALDPHGVARGTGDIDVWIDRAPEIAARVWPA